MIEKEIEPKNTEKEKLTLRDAIKTYISLEIYNIGFISLFIIDNLNTYLISYLREFQGENKTLKLEYTYFFGIIEVCFK